MRYAFISDIHRKTQTLIAFAEAVRKDEVDLIVCLGDTGADSAYDLLRTLSAEGAFGNYEVSGYRHLSPLNRAYVLDLPAVFSHDNFLAAHAVPYHPPGLFKAVDFYDYMAKTGTSWRALFPYPGEDVEVIWKIYAELLVRKKKIFFHGHTHRQKISAIYPGERLRSIPENRLVLEEDVYYVVGVGSLGHPEDGPYPRYAIYDDRECRLEFKELK